MTHTHKTLKLHSSTDHSGKMSDSVGKVTDPQVVQRCEFRTRRITLKDPPTTINQTTGPITVQWEKKMWWEFVNRVMNIRS